MNALTLHQPWAWFVVHGFKRWETRSWSSDDFGPLLIHASQKVDELGRDVYYQVRAEFGDAIFQPHHPPPFDELPRGAIVGRVHFGLCHNFSIGSRSKMEEMLGDFTPGRWFWQLENPSVFNPPIATRGFQKIWNYRGPLPLDPGGAR